MYKFLFFVPSPRNIAEVKTEIVSNLYKKHDVIWYKYFREIEAYQKAREFFLNSAENYDYLVILPDDLVLNKEGLDNLMAEIERPSLKGVGRYPILAGICNVSFVNQQQMESVAALNAVLPTLDNMSSIEIWDHMIKFKDLENRPENILACKYIGFSVYFIHRSIVNKIPFRNDDPYQPKEGVDSMFSKDLDMMGIKQYIDKRSRFLHLKGLSAQNIKSISTNPDEILVGKIKSHIIFVKREKTVRNVENTPKKIDSEVIVSGNIPNKQEIEVEEQIATGNLLQQSEKIRDLQYTRGKRGPIPGQARKKRNSSKQTN